METKKTEPGKHNIGRGELLARHEKGKPAFIPSTARPLGPQRKTRLVVRTPGAGKRG